MRILSFKLSFIFSRITNWYNHYFNNPISPQEIAQAELRTSKIAYLTACSNHENWAGQKAILEVRIARLEMYLNLPKSIKE